jgi:hypothetical protein
MVGSHHRVVVLRPETPLHYCQETRHANLFPSIPNIPGGIINNWHAQQEIQTTIGVLSMIQNRNRIINKATNNNSNPTLLQIGVDICAASAKFLSFISLSLSLSLSLLLTVFPAFAKFSKSTRHSSLSLPIRHN